MKNVKRVCHAPYWRLFYGLQEELNNPTYYKYTLLCTTHSYSIQLLFYCRNNHISWQAASVHLFPLHILRHLVEKWLIQL